jgi:hypothetical protein
MREGVQELQNTEGDMRAENTEDGKELDQEVRNIRLRILQLLNS